MSWFESGASTIYYEEEGSGDPVLLLPGVGGSIEQFSALRNALKSKFKVIGADPPGSGKSGPQPRDYTATYYHEDARVVELRWGGGGTGHPRVRAVRGD